MERVPAIRNILNAIGQFFLIIGRLLTLLWRMIRVGSSKLWAWLRLHLPFLEAYIERHVRNPATVFMDAASALLVLYLLFGAIGYVAVYQKKAEGRFTETLTILYPFPAAKVDKSVVWNHLFLQRLRFLNTFNSQIPADAASKPPTAQELRQKIIEGLVEDKIILLEAKKRGLSVSEEELQAAYEKQQKQTENFEARIKQLYGMSPDEFRQVVAETLLTEKVKRSAVTRIHVLHILTTDESVIKEAKRQIDGGKPFDQAAKEFSQDTQTRDKGGDLGFWTKGELAAQIAPGFEETAFSLAANQVSGPVQSKFGWHLIQVTERSGDNLQTYQEWYEQAKKDYKIKIYIPI